MTDTGIGAYASLGDDVNKVKSKDGQDTDIGVVSEKLPELALDMKNEEIIKLTQKWEDKWKNSSKKSDWEKQIEENEKYWLGKQFDSLKGDKRRAMVDNLIFESLETYLPQVTRRNPEPMVMLAPSETPIGAQQNPAHTAYVEKVKSRLSALADRNKLRLKLKKTGRHWAIYQLGILKFGWDLDKNIPIVRCIRAPKIILDPDAIIDEDGYSGAYIGEYKKEEAGKILAIVGQETEENKEGIQAIKDLVGSDTATEVQFIEWWTRDYMCWTLKDKVLFKTKNLHWNYDRTENPNPENIADPNVQVDEYGNVQAQPVEVPGINHFESPQMPYVFLTVFNLGDQPMDKTSLIGQNLSNQDLINKRNKQIDKNVDRQNGGMVVSLERSGLSQSQAKNVAQTIRNGGVVAIPSGAPRDAVDQYTPGNLPSDVFNHLYDIRNRLRDIFGTKGTTPTGLESEKTVGGKIISRGLDTDRIGGGVSEYLEQVADDIYNWFVQMLYVYDDAFQFVGGAKPPKVIVSVKEGSLLPKDSIAIANQAFELAGMGRISTIDLFKKLEYPNAEEMAANVWLETNAPELLYRDNQLVQEALQMRQQAAMVQAQQEMQKEEMKHQQDMEKEVVKGKVKQKSEG